MENFTQWQTFFMLLTVIPFSKMILSVLVKTVMPRRPEGNKWSVSILGAGMVLSAARRIKPLRRGENNNPSKKPAGLT